jgi:hypothetical protein
VHELGQQRGRAGEQERDQLDDGDAHVGAQRGQDGEQAAGPLLLFLGRLVWLGCLVTRPIGGGGSQAGALARPIVSFDAGFLPG